MKIRFIILLFCCVFVSVCSGEEKTFDDTIKQWDFISSAIRSNPNIKCKNLPSEVPGGFYSHGETKFTLEIGEKIRIMKENCIEALSSLLEVHLPRSQRKYSFKFSDINSFDEIMKSFCSDTANKYFRISGFLGSINTENPTETKSIHERTNQILLNSNEDSFHDYEAKNDQIILPKKNIFTLGKTTKEKKCSTNQLDFSKTPSELTTEGLGHSVAEYEQFESEGTPISKYKTPKVLTTILKSVLDENKEDLPALEITISQLPKQVQNRVISFFRSKNIDGVVEVLNKLPRQIVESFINSIELEKKQLKFQLGTSSEQLEFSVPLLEDEWRAIVDFMGDPSSPVQYEKKIDPYKQIKIPKEFKYSNGILKKFLQYCRRGIRSLAYEKYISEDGVTYYSYNENNLNGILIAGNDSDNRKEQVEAFCYMVFERLYGKKEREMMNKRHTKALEIKKSWEDGGVKGAVIDQLLKSFSDEINDERLQWLFLVESASVPNPLVYSTDLPKHTIPISFTSKPTDAVTEIAGKIRSFVYNCRNALMTLGVEQLPGAKTPLNKIHLGVDKVQGLIKFCKSVAHRYMGRLVEWFNIIQASLDDDIIRLVDMKNPEFRCPDYFEYEDESKLADNCSKTILMMINENKKAEENRRAKVWKGLKIKCQPNHINQQIRSFCNSVANERPDIRIASINELSELGIGSELSSVEEIREGYNKEQQALEIVEERLKIIESKQIEQQANSAYKLDRWNQIQEFMVENRRIREKLDKYSRRQFQKLFEIEDAQKDLLLSLSSEDIISEKKKENIRDLIDKYSSDLLSMRTEWADLLFQISNNNRKLTEAEIEIMNFVHQALDYIAISHRVELLNSSTMANMVNWEETLIEKERTYINTKMLEYTSRLDSDQKIQKLKDIHYKRRQLFEKNLYRILPRKLWNKINSLAGKGLHPLIPIKISEKELKERKSLIVKLHEEKNNMIAKYDSEGQKLARQLIVIEKVVDKHLADLNEMWDSTYSIEYSIQWELRIKDMQDTYLYLNNEYNKNAEFITRQQLRQSQLQIGNPHYQQLLSETNQSIEIATDEMKKLLKLMNELRQKRNELDTLVESDLSKSYAEKINTLRRNSKLLEDNISSDISILQKKNEISQLQLNRDIKYFEITNMRSALSERLKKSEGLIEANIWLNTKNEQLFSGYESKLNDDLSSLTYTFEKPNKYETHFTTEEIPNEALSELNKYKEQLKISLFNVMFYNDKISDNDMQHIRQFESMDANALAYKEIFESEGDIDDGTLYGELSTLEWNVIQSRWELLKMKHFYIEKKEKILLECAEMRNSLDELMLQKYGMIPITKPKDVPNKARILAMKGIGINLGDELDASNESNNLSYDGKVLKLVQKRLEDANSVFEQELSNRLSILDEKIREGRIRLHEAAREVVSSWELQQSTASFRFASPQNKDRMREAFIRERDKVTKDEIKKTIPLKLEKHILLQQQKDRALQFKRDIDWIHTPGRVASQLMKFEQKIRIFRKKRHDHYERTLKFLTYQAEQVDRIKQIDEELNAEETNGSRSNGLATPEINTQDLKREREKLEADLAQKRREYQMQLSSFQNERDALYDVSKNLKDEENS